MNQELLLAIDAGTGSARAALFTPEGELIAAGQREYTPSSASRRPWFTGIRFGEQLEVDLRLYP